NSVAGAGGAAAGRPGRRLVRARVIMANDENSFTTLSERDVEIEDGVPLDPGLALATVIPRAAARPGAAPYQPVMVLIDGLGLTAGAYATTFAHDSHNIFVIGRRPAAMAVALEAVLAAGGGMAFAPDITGSSDTATSAVGGDSSAGTTDRSGQAVTLLRLPLAALLSDESSASVA